MTYGFMIGTTRAFFGALGCGGTKEDGCFMVCAFCGAPGGTKEDDCSMIGTTRAFFGALGGTKEDD